MRACILAAGAAVGCLALLALVSYSHDHAAVLYGVQPFYVPVRYFTPTMSLRMADAPYRLAGYEVPGTKHNNRPPTANDAGPQRLEGYWPGPTHTWPPANKAPMSQLGYITEAVDPPWVATGQRPLDYYQSQSAHHSGVLDYWVGMDPEQIRPDLYEARPPLDNIDHWVKNVGWGGLRLDDNGTAITYHGFMAHNLNCSDGGLCQNADICMNDRCVPAIFNGTDAVNASVTANKRLQAKQQQLMFNMVYEHHEMPPMAFGTGSVHDNGALPEVSSDVKAQMKAAGKDLAGDKTGIWYDPYSGSYGNDGLAAEDAKLKMQVQQLRQIATAQSHEEAGLRREAYMRFQRQHALGQGSGEASTQSLAMGGGTPLDLTFGVGGDGEPPYHLHTVAESVRNGILDPNAPETLPYAQVKGSGTSNKIGAVGYMSPLHGAPGQPEEEEGAIEGTVA